VEEDPYDESLNEKSLVSCYFEHSTLDERLFGKSYQDFVDDYWSETSDEEFESDDYNYIDDQWFESGYIASDNYDFQRDYWDND